MPDLQRQYPKIFVMIFSLLFLGSCKPKKADPTTLYALEILYLIRSQPTISCYYTASNGTEYCLQNPNIASNLGSTCQFQPILADGARTVYNSSSTCQSMGYPNCVTITSGNSSYEKCTR